MLVGALALTGLTQTSGSAGPGRRGANPTTAPGAVAGVLAGARHAAGRPNIVFVLTDDLATNLVAHMPAVQQLQHDGTSLSNYYVVNSLCCPSRTAIFTGEYPHDSGVLTNVGRVGGYPAFQRNGDEYRTFALALHRAGYRTGFFGKYLNGYDPSSPVPPGWDSWGATAYGYREFDYRLNVDGTVRHYGHRPQDYLTDVISGMGDRFIRTSAAAHRPFLLELASFAPHMPYVPAPRYATAAAGVSYPRTPAFGRLPTGAPSWLAHGRPALSPTDVAGIDHDYRLRVQSDLSVDDLLRSVRETLRAAGVANDTYVVFSSDNGYHMGEYDLLPGKQTAFDTDTRVPLVVAGPGVPAGSTMPAMASSIDLAPTFESLGGVRPGPRVDGVSLAALWHGSVPPDWQRSVLFEHYGPDVNPRDPDAASFRSGIPLSYSAVRTAGALYVQYVNGEREYYDTRSDPYELHNLAARGVPPSLQRMLAGLRDCHGWVACQAGTG